MSRQQGMSLIEILLIVLVVSVGMAATAKFQGDLLQTGATTKARTQALAFVQTEIEALRINHGAAAGGTQDDVAGANTAYDVSWSVSALAGLTDTDSYTATVSWSDNQNRSQSVQLGTILYADRMLGGGDADSAVRALAARCVFIASGCEVEAPLPEVTAEVIVAEESNFEGINNSGILEKEGLTEINPRPGEVDLSLLSGSELYIEKLNGSYSFIGLLSTVKLFIDDDTSGSYNVVLAGATLAGELLGRGYNDAIYINGGLRGSAVISMGGGDDSLHIADNISGSAVVRLGDGSDTFYLGGAISGSARIYGEGLTKDTGVDVICLASYEKSQWSSVKGFLSGFEIILFNDGYQYENGFSDTSYPIPQGCNPDQSYRYTYPVNLNIKFPESNTSSLAKLVNYYPESSVSGDSVIASGVETWLQIDATKTLPDDPDTIQVSFELNTVDKVVLSDAVLVCAAWGGTDNKELQIALWSRFEKTSCN